MNELLASNYSPLKTKHSSFIDKFYTLFAKAAYLRIGVGYISQDSLAELLQTLDINPKTYLELVIGMHYFQGFEKSQLLAAQKLHSFLTKKQMGGVFVSTQFPYHGKAYVFADSSDKAFAGIVGSNNLSSIVPSTSRIYESALFMDEASLVNDLDDFLRKLIGNCHSIDGLNPRIIDSSAPLNNQADVIKVGTEELFKFQSLATDIFFSIPLKADPQRHGKSNLNVYFGKGRENKSTGIILPRPWYETELIVPKEITGNAEYPNASDNGGIFTVITDDGWKFDCKVSGDYNKNLRSAGSLTTLGRWIKGRLENAGLLIPGEQVTDNMLLEYGCNNLTLIKTKQENVWLLSFQNFQGF